MKRLSSFELTTKEQMRAIFSPTANEIVQALRHSGPSSASEIAEIIGKKANSLHYHLRRLVKQELLTVVETRMSGARAEKVYDVASERFLSDQYLESETLRKIVVDGIRRFLRNAAREFSNATKLLDNPKKNEARKLIGSRYCATLTEEQLLELNKHFDEISRIFAKNSGSKEGTRFSFTAVLAPVSGVENSSNKES